jgi:hypothetical protein
MAYLGLIVEVIGKMLKDIAKWQQVAVKVFDVEIPAASWRIDKKLTVLLNTIRLLVNSVQQIRADGGA